MHNLKRHVIRSLPLTHTMTLVSDDPSLWPLINYFRGYSYFTGSCGKSDYVGGISLGPIFHCGSAVAATTALIYDCGEQDCTYQGNIDVPTVFSSTDTRTRGGCFRSRHLTNTNKFYRLT
jgi:hypothetical protein